MQPLFFPLFLIGEDAPDRSLNWGALSGGKGGLLDSILVRVGPKQKVPLLLSFRRFVSLVNGLTRGVEACPLALRSWPGAE